MTLEVFSGFQFPYCKDSFLEADIKLSENEDFILLRVHSPATGKVVSDFYYTNKHKIKNVRPLHLNSDLYIRKAPIARTDFVVKVSETDKIVLLKAEKATYGIIHVGNYSDYWDAYIWNVESGKVNYIGDITLDVAEGTLPKNKKNKRLLRHERCRQLQ